MATTYPFTPAQIEKYEREFEQANHRAHARFAAGAILVGLLMLGLLIVALYEFQSWAV